MSHSCRVTFSPMFFGYLTAKTVRFLVGSKESILTPQGGLGGIRGESGEAGATLNYPYSELPFGPPEVPKS